MSITNKLKILNDPIYGFITIPNALIFDIIEHPYFQRLRRVTQLGLTYLVYPGAYHTRFHHALGAMHLMTQAVRTLRAKGQEISAEEEEAVLIAILLHDIGHGPFSHALEHSLIPGISHEKLSIEYMKVLNKDFNGKLTLAIQIFSNKYHKHFLHQLISSQLDMDRLDYLRRDCFYTGVSEGRVNTERLISMLNVKNDQVVLDAKGIYSVEKFIVARRLMYWQVYLHKTVLSAEFLLINILRRAKEVYTPDMPMPSTLRPFVSGEINMGYAQLLPLYSRVDDSDILAAIKEWSYSSNPILALMCQMLLDRKLLGVQILNGPVEADRLAELRKAAALQFNISVKEAEYFVFDHPMSNNAYNPDRESILLLYKDGTTKDVAQAADHLNLSALAKTVTKHFLFYPKALRING